MTHYWIIEHPTLGVLRDLEETAAGNVGRFSFTASRSDPENVERLWSPSRAQRALAKITPRSKRERCQILMLTDSGWEVVR